MLDRGVQHLEQSNLNTTSMAPSAQSLRGKHPSSGLHLLKRVIVSHGRLIEMACTPLVQKGTLRALFDFGHRTDPHLARSKILQYSASHNLQYNHSEQELEQNPGPGTGDMNREQATRAALKPLLYFFPAFGLLAASGVRQRPPAA